VSFSPGWSPNKIDQRREPQVRFIALDVHRDFCEVAISDGGRARSAGRIDTTPQALQLFAGSLAPTDRVVLESTGNALAIARILEPHVAEVVVANPMQVRGGGPRSRRTLNGGPSRPVRCRRQRSGC
jgi:hypothetical protein